MNLSLKFQWTTNEIPPRCRKPRAVTHTKEVSVNITEVSKTEAEALMPIALIVHTELYREAEAKHKPMYLFQGRLFEADELSRTPERLLARYAYETIYVDSEDDIPARMREIERLFIIRDGVVCAAADEPIYEIIFTMSGPFIHVAYASEGAELSDRQFRADELNEAIQGALCGDTYVPDDRRKYLESTGTDSCRIDILLPEALTMQPYLNRQATNIEKMVISCLKEGFRFEPSILQEGAGLKLTREVCREVYANVEFQKRRYLIYPSDIVEVVHNVILKRFQL